MHINFGSTFNDDSINTVLFILIHVTFYVYFQQETKELLDSDDDRTQEKTEGNYQLEYTMFKPQFWGQVEMILSHR